MVAKGMTIKIETRGLVDLRDLFGRYVTKLPKAANKDLKTITDDYVFEYKQELLSRFPEFYWSEGGELVSSIRTEPIEGGYQIPMSIHGIYLDRMRTHLVSPWKHEILYRWVMEKLGYAPKVITVRAHPWMDSAQIKARERILGRLKEGEFHKTIEQRGR